MTRSFLDQIRPAIRDQIKRHRSDRPLQTLKKEIDAGDHSFRKAIASGEEPSLIAEFKRSSPSAGTIDPDASLSAYVRSYDRHADAISILTEPSHFDGDPTFLQKARRDTDRPLLRKDFVIDPYQVYEARYFGADAVLLIEGMLSDERLRELIDLTEALGMDPLVECHSREGLNRILKTEARLVGINNRNLDTIEMDPDRARRLVEELPDEVRADRLIVAESGLSSRADVRRLRGIADAVLVGTSIMRAPNTSLKLRELTGDTLVKFCGITDSSDARSAVKAGADVIGLNFYRESSRYVTPETAGQIADEVRGEVLLAGVFVNAGPEEVRTIAEDVDLDLLQFSGDESPNFVRKIRELGRPIIKAVHVSGEEDLQQLEAYDAEYLMVDADVEGRYGGTGERVDTSLIEAADPDPGTLVVAGGLTPENAPEIRDRLAPIMLDVCSGIETEPGRKDPGEMNAFIEALSDPNAS